MDRLVSRYPTTPPPPPPPPPPAPTTASVTAAETNTITNSASDHEHLDDKDLCGEFVVKGKKSPLDGLNVGWEDYMTQLSDTPNETIEIELANPNQGYVRPTHWSQAR